MQVFFFFLPIFDKKIVFLRLISRLVSFFLEETEGLLNTASKHTKNLITTLIGLKQILMTEKKRKKKY